MIDWLVFYAVTEVFFKGIYDGIILYLCITKKYVTPLCLHYVFFTLCNFTSDKYYIYLSYESVVLKGFDNFSVQFKRDCYLCQCNLYV